MKEKIYALIRAIILAGITLSLITGCSSKKGDDTKSSTTTPTIPVVTTDDITNITFTSAEVSGTIVSNGNSPIQSSGLCWSPNPSPTIANNKLPYGSGSGSFKTNIENLVEGSDYYVRAYATNSVGTGYGAEKKFTTGLSCQTMVARHPGYQVWAGNTPYFQLNNNFDYFYSIDKYDYTLIGESTTTATFNTGSYKYYVIVSKYWNCVDAIKFNDGSYYNNGQGYTLITGLTDVAQITGPPDGVFGKFGYKTLCPPNGTATYNGFITDDATISSRGGGLTVICGTGCQ